MTPQGTAHTTGLHLLADLPPRGKGAEVDVLVVGRHV